MSGASFPAVTRWVVPALELVPAAPEVNIEEVAAAEVVPPSIEEIQAIRDEAHAAGYTEGLAAGHAEGMGKGYAQSQAEVRRLIAQMEGILDNFTRPLARLESEVTAALGELAVRIAGHLARRAYASDPSLLTALLAEALDAVGSATREVEVHLHPDDLKMLSTQMKSGQALPAALLTLPEGVRLIPDAALSRGDLRIHTESVRIDGCLNARLEQALEKVMQQAEGMA